MTSARWFMRLSAAGALAALTASCITPAPELSHPQAWTAVRGAYAPRLAQHAAGQETGGGAAPIEAERMFDEAARRDAWAWENARRRDEQDEYERYLRENPDGEYRIQAQRRMDQLRAGDEADWSRADLRDSIEAYQNYLANNPDGAYRDQAYRRISELRALQYNRRDHQWLWQPRLPPRRPPTIRPRPEPEPSPSPPPRALEPRRPPDAMRAPLPVTTPRESPRAAPALATPPTMRAPSSAAPTTTSSVAPWPAPAAPPATTSAARPPAPVAQPRPAQVIGRTSPSTAASVRRAEPPSRP